MFHRDHVVAGHPAEAQSPLGVQRELDVIAIAVRQERDPSGGPHRRPGGVRQRDDVGDRRICDAAEAAQLIRDDLLLELGLARVGDVLPLTAAAGVRSRAEVGAGRCHAIRAGFQYVQHRAACPTIPLLDDLDPHTLAWDGVGYEDGLATVSADASPPWAMASRLIS